MTIHSVFRGHLVLCGWNRRGKVIVESLQQLSSRPIVIVHTEIQEVIREVGTRPNIFVMAGDSGTKVALLRADVEYAYSVLVLALDSMGDTADARSVQIALAVERIKTAVYTVVELRDLQNKDHFSWTKVDDLVTDQEIAVRMLAQGIRHITAMPQDKSDMNRERHLLGLYRTLIEPSDKHAQIFRIDVPWAKARGLSFRNLLEKGLSLSVLPLALVGFKKHKVPAMSPDANAWVSWKSDVFANPPGRMRSSDLWPEWPGDTYPLGVLVLARSRELAQKLVQAV